MAQVVMNRNSKFFTESRDEPFPWRQGLFFPLIMEFMMSKIVSAVKAFVADEDGVTAIEYGLIAALVGVAIITAVGDVGDQLKLTFNNIVTQMKAA
jgi:pilus assembly protein Flp/PilA